MEVLIMGEQEWLMLEQHAVLDRIEASFKPFRCVAQMWDYDAKVRFRVFNEMDEGIATVPKLPFRVARNEKLLRGVLNAVRAGIGSRGYIMRPI